MPQNRYEVTAPNGKVIEIDGPNPPSEAALQQIFARLEQSQPPAAPEPPPESGGGIGTFLSHAASRLNPIPAAQAFGKMVIPEAAARAMGAGDAEAEQYGPLNTVRNMGRATQDVFEQAKKAYDAGDYGSAAIKALFGAMPLVGPDFNQMGDNMRAGNVAEALGDAAGTGLSLAAPQVVSAVAPAINATKAKVAAVADRASQNKVVQAMVPTIGPNKRRFGNMAADVAPRVARETSAITREGMIDEFGAKLEDASAKLDAAYDVVPNTKQYPTQPIIDGLRVQIKNLSVGGPGGTVEPATRAARLASLKTALEEVQALGKTANLDNLRKLKQSWGEGGKAVFTPDIAADAAKLKNAGHGWADANSVVGDYLGTQHPELAPLNADVSLWIKAKDVVTAAEEIERVRPTVGRSIMARGIGAAAGAAGGGVPGAITGAIVAPLIERVIGSASPAMKITIGRQLARVADALRKGNQAKAQTLLESITKMVPAGAAARGASEASALPQAAENETAPPRQGRR